MSYAAVGYWWETCPAGTEDVDSTHMVKACCPPGAVVTWFGGAIWETTGTCGSKGLVPCGGDGENYGCCCQPKSATPSPAAPPPQQAAPPDDPPPTVATTPAPPAASSPPVPASTAPAISTVALVLGGTALALGILYFKAP